MLCDNCKVNQATVHLTEIVDEEMTELHLCEDCAREKSATMEQHFGLSDLLAGLADLGAQFGTEEEIRLSCANCGMTTSDFKRIGRLGCSECYRSFEKSLAGLLKRIQGSSHHVGKSPEQREGREPYPAPTPTPPAPVRTPSGPKADPSATPRGERTKEPKDPLQELREKLQKAIREEAFEEAAKLRDKIRELEKKSKQQAKG